MLDFYSEFKFSSFSKISIIFLNERTKINRVKGLRIEFRTITAYNFVEMCTWKDMF